MLLLLLNDNDVLPSALQYACPAHRVQLLGVLRGAAIVIGSMGRVSVLLLLLEHRGTE